MCIESYLHAYMHLNSSYQEIDDISLKPVRFCHSEGRFYEHGMDIQNQAYLALI